MLVFPALACSENVKGQLQMNLMILRKFVLIFLLFQLTSCWFLDTNCCDKIRSREISKGLYIEYYRTFCAGVLGEVTECYVTDSVSFRAKVGSFDEHERLKIKFENGVLTIYNTRYSMIHDTIESKIISKSNLSKFHHLDKECLRINPIFGTNTITCDSDYYPSTEYETEENYFITNTQYKCGNKYQNAVYFGDSSTFRVLIGIYEPGSLENNYSVEKHNDNSFAFYNITLRDLIDTIKTKEFALTELKNQNLKTVCK